LISNLEEKIIECFRKLLKGKIDQIFYFCSFADIAIITAWVLAHSLKLEDMDRDGNCAYRMYCRLLGLPHKYFWFNIYFLESQWPWMREQIASYIEIHRIDFESIAIGTNFIVCTYIFQLWV